MAEKSINRNRLKTFYLDGQLLRSLKVDRTNNLIYVWNFTKSKRECYVLSDVRLRKQNAFTITETAKMINRHRRRIVEYLGTGIRIPQRAINLSTGKNGPYYFSEDEVLDLYDHFASLHCGRPRKDGLVSPKDMPTKKALAAMMRHDTSLFVKNENGNFVPVWRERYI